MKETNFSEIIMDYFKTRKNTGVPTECWTNTITYSSLIKIIKKAAPEKIITKTNKGEIL